MEHCLLVERNDRNVITLTLNRPAQHNALDRALVKALSAEMKAIAQDTDLRIVILTGIGKSFCSGADLKRMGLAQESDEVIRTKALELASMMANLYALPQASIARVNGPAFGGGLGLIACCDFAIATTEARFAFTETRLGLVPAVIAPYVINAMGARQAKKYFLSADMIDAGQALTIGLVDRVVDHKHLDEALCERVEDLLRAGPRAVTECKRLVDTIVPITPETVRYTAEINAKVRASPEGRDGIAAFLEKRDPHWRNIMKQARP